MEPVHSLTPRPPQVAPALGAVTAVTGGRIGAGLFQPSQDGIGDLRATVGRLVRIESGNTLVFGIITDLTSETSEFARREGYVAAARIDLVGEIKPASRFQRGVTAYPTIGDRIMLAGRADLELVYRASDDRTITMGHLQHDASVGAFVKVNEALSKHFAIVGATGVGKSSALTVMLQKVMDATPDLRIFLIDVHNEYGNAFGKRAQVLTPGNVRLPFWLFSFEEMVDVVFGGRPGLDEEVDILAETIPLAKASYAQSRSAVERSSSLKKVDPRSIGFTVDTPVPYRLSDLTTLIDERMGKLENRASRLIYHRLLTRLETIGGDPRYAFMFENANVGGDTMAEVLGRIFRIPANGIPMTVMQLAGFPAEVVDAVVSVLCRMAFDFALWSESVMPLLFVCEEAHRYAAADRTVGFGPTRRALSRIAKEGRKYGVYLGLVSQRPAELDATILSQCSTIFAMRLSNERDHALLRSAIPDAGANLLSFLPALGTGEVLAFGEGVAMPIRFKVTEIQEGLLRKPDDAVLNRSSGPQLGGDLIAETVRRWRGATMSLKLKPDAAEPPPMAAPVTEMDRLAALKRSLESRAELLAAGRSTDTNSAA
jgi:DNA helicase HerA-like ATPase